MESKFNPYVECPEEYLEDCIDILKSPEVFGKLGEEPGFNEGEIKRALREGYEDLGLKGITLEVKVEEGFEKFYTQIQEDKVYESYAYFQELATVLYGFSQFEIGDGEELEREGYERELIIETIRKDMLAGLSQHVPECVDCLRRYDRILERRVKEAIFEGSLERARLIGAEDNFNSRRLYTLKRMVDYQLLGIK